MTHNEKKNQPTKTNPEMAPIIEAAGKDIKIVILTTFRDQECKDRQC